MRKIAACLARLHRDSKGLALLEFALSLPILLALSLTGAELTNFITTRMRLSQLALHIADNGARIGTGGQLMVKKISEGDIDDLLTGAGLQAGELDLYTHGRVIISSLEPDPDHNDRYKIGWQRCRGDLTSHDSAFGEENDDNLTGMGPIDQKVTAPAGGGTIFVEVYYEYQPLVKTSLAPESAMTEIASMMVRDTRDYSRIYDTPGVTASTC
ncbi:pilus assembly protein [Sphingosinithalassobacter tenebrarum]|uniref:Pilus assembly protein n=1 Tax=Stakelama tenebrarum TaxID=2711215 RepID=A0A6G6YAK1_9SPHN|nr:pilus assembly protein [Sphingosinithalassobacter tenebrarum]